MRDKGGMVGVGLLDTAVEHHDGLGALDNLGLGTKETKANMEQGDVETLWLCFLCGKRSTV